MSSNALRFPRIPRSRALTLGAGLLIATTLTPDQGRAFYEEENTNPSESTIHFSLIKALAVCAGYEELAPEVATYDQLVDVGSDPAYSGNLCQGTVRSTPKTPSKAKSGGATLTDLVPGSVNGCIDTSRMVFPTSVPAAGQACTTGRGQGFYHFFHFPSSANLTSLRTWAYKTSVTLKADWFAAYGGTAAMSNTYRCQAVWPNQTVTLGGGIASGSPKALGIYLHSLADRASHFDCISHVASSTEPLKYPTHHGQWGQDACAFPHHYDEFEQYSTALGEAPLYRTLESIIGRTDMQGIYGSPLPYANPYNFPSIYGELLAWRTAFPSYFTGNPAPLPMDINNMDYQAVLESIQNMIMGHAQPDGRLNALYRIEDAEDIAAFCQAIQ